MAGEADRISPYAKMSGQLVTHLIWHIYLFIYFVRLFMGLFFSFSSSQQPYEVCSAKRETDPSCSLFPPFSHILRKRHFLFPHGISKSVAHALPGCCVLGHSLIMKWLRGLYQLVSFISPGIGSLSDFSDFCSEKF